MLPKNMFFFCYKNQNSIKYCPYVNENDCPNNCNYAINNMIESQIPLDMELEAKQKLNKGLENLTKKICKE